MTARPALHEASEDPEAQVARIEALVVAQRPAEALPACLRLIAQHPGADAYCRFGFVLGELGRFADAAVALRHAVALDPNHAEAHFRLAPNLVRLGRADEALAACCRLVALRPDNANAWSGFGVALAELGRWEEALAMCGKALELEPDNAFLAYTLARVAWYAGALEAAVGMLDRAIALAPDRVQMRWDRAMVKLLQGRFAEGWREAECRWDTAQMRADQRGHAAPVWLGGGVAGRTVLLHAEQGLGDTMQFVRYAPLLAARGARVLLQVQPPLMRLLRGLPGVAALLSYADPAPAHDLRCPLLSLPLAFGTEPDMVPPPVAPPPDPEAGARWRARLAPFGRRRVGLVWAGNASHWNDRNRSVPLDALRPLLALPGIDWFGLQVGPRAADLAVLPPGQVHDLSPELTDFAETAAALRELDLLISVDTSCAHLAGMLGVPAWTLLPFTPDWRWLQGRDDTPWYPSMRLFRQAAFGEWDGVVQRVRAALLDGPEGA